MDASGHFTAFYSDCLCEGVNCGAGGACHTGGCDCMEGWNGERCADVDECADGTHGCHANANCSNFPVGSYTCTCQDGYGGNGMSSPCRRLHFGKLAYPNPRD